MKPLKDRALLALVVWLLLQNPSEAYSVKEVDIQSVLVGKRECIVAVYVRDVAIDCDF